MAKKKAVKFRRRFYGRIGSIPLKILLFILRILPLKCLYIVGERTAQLVFRGLRRRRHITLDNLRLALGDEKSEGEILKIYRSMLRNIARGGVEILSYPRLRNGYFKRMIQIEGREHLDEALKLGKGVVALSVHMGNFPFVPIELSRQGYSASVILRYPRLEGMARYLDAVGDRSGVRIIPDKPSRVCVGQSLKSLKENEVLFVLMDLNVSHGGIYVNFFGRMVPTFKGPVVLAMRTGASILPVFIVREDGNRHRILIDPPVKLELTGHMETDVFTNLTKLSKIAESYVRKYPDQWWWIHRRWRKARPL